jgi:hypothetical protein
MIKKFKEESRFEIPSRGLVIVVKLDEDTERSMLRDWIGSVVDIDDERYWVDGVESWAIHRLSKGAPIGLLVRPTYGECCNDRGGFDFRKTFTIMDWEGAGDKNIKINAPGEGAYYKTIEDE